MIIPKHKVFISYQHSNDQGYKESLIDWNESNDCDIFINTSVDTGDIDENLNDESIRQKIRDDYLGNSTVTILLVGTGTKKRKHVDWEIYSSMYDGRVNKKSGILVVNLPSINCIYYTAPHGNDEKEALYDDSIVWNSVTTRVEYERRYPYMPERIIDNLLNDRCKISVVNWETIAGHPDKLKRAIDLTFNDKCNCYYDLSREMRRSNS
jgi:hypothetical protein